MSTSVRAFIAVDPSPETHAALVALKHDLAAAGGDVKWVRDENLHCTLKFLGNVEPARLEAVRAAVQGVTAMHPCFANNARGIGVFPSPARPRIVWVGFRTPALTALAAELERALEPLEFKVEGRPFSGHITLGRVNGRRGWERLEAQMRARGDESFGETVVTQVIVYRSQLQRGGSVYSPLWTIPLGDSTVASR